MKTNSFLIAILMTCAFNANAGTFRIPDGRGETSDYGVISASVRKGVVTIEAVNQKEQKFFNISANVLKANGIEAGSLISLILNENLNTSIFCTTNKYDELSCDDIVVSTRRK